jgi:hypothetical protein
VAISADPWRTTDAAILNLSAHLYHSVPRLGVLAGRRSPLFSPSSGYSEWIVSQDMNYNLFICASQWTIKPLMFYFSHPELAFPTSVDNPGKVYLAKGILRTHAYAKSSRYSHHARNQRSGHVGSWAGVPGPSIALPRVYMCWKDMDCRST